MPAAARRGQAISQTHSIPPPVGGLNASSAIAAMPETDAILMDNWFPQPTLVSLRNGSSNWVTGITGWIETLMGYANKSGVEKLFAIAGTSVFDASTQGAVGGAVVSGLTNARWESVNVGTPAGAFLYAANATDKPLLYNGTTWTHVDGSSSPAITGVTTTTLRNPTVWKNRVWFVQDGTLLVDGTYPFSQLAELLIHLRFECSISPRWYAPGDPDIFGFIGHVL